MRGEYDPWDPSFHNSSMIPYSLASIYPSIENLPEEFSNENNKIKNVLKNFIWSFKLKKNYVRVSSLFGEYCRSVVN